MNTRADLAKIKWAAWPALFAVGFGWAGWLSLTAIANSQTVARIDERQKTQFEQLREDIGDQKILAEQLRTDIAEIKSMVSK